MAHEPRLQELLRRWELLRQQGRDISPDELCSDCPDLLPELRRLLQADAPPEAPQETVDGLPAPPVAEPETVPGYEIVGELGRGGMGVVYQARQVKANRVVALKMILAGGHAGNAELARFKTEAEAIARLSHPHIVQVYEVGEHEGRPFFSLEYCPAGSLERKLNGTPLPPADAAKLGETLARAMHAAHQAQVIHRDLKPANVLLAADGSPRVTDFGLAKKLDDVGQTQSGAIMGTPSYMAPEQAGGRVEEFGPATDVYALGAILYECLTGRPPFRASTAFDTLLQVLGGEPVLVRQLQPKVPRDLETICLKCLQKERGRRYSSAEALAEDLRRFQAGEPIHARPVGTAERMAKWVKRRPALATLLALVVLVTLGGMAGISWAYGKALHEKTRAENAEANATRERDTAVEQKTRAENAEADAKRERNTALERAEEVRRQLAFSKIALAEASWREGHAAMAQQHLDAVPGDLRHWEWRYLQRASEGSLFTLYGHTSALRSVAFSPDSQRLATGSSDKTAKVWDARSGQLLLSLQGHTNGVTSVAFSPDGQRLASGSSDKTAKVWDARTGQLLLSLEGHTNIVTSVAFSPDGQRLATGSGEYSKPGEAKVWDARTGQLLLSLQGHTNGVTSVAFSPDGQRLASGSSDKTAKVWDARTGQLLLSLQGHTGSVYSVTFSPDGQRLATASWGRTAKVWDTRTGQLLLSLQGHSINVTSVAFSPDGQRLATGSGHQVYPGKPGEAKVWDARTGQELLALQGHTDSVWSVAFSPDSQRLATGCEDRTAKVWDARTGQPLPTGSWLSGVESAAFSPDSQRLATSSLDKTAKVWDARSGQQQLSLQGHTGSVNSVAFSPDGQRLATVSMDRTAKVWDARSGQPLLSLQGHTDSVYSVAFSPDGQRLATGSGDTSNGGKPGETKVWDARSGQPLLSLQGHRRVVMSVAFSPDGQRLATGSWDKTAKVWDARSGQPLLSLQGHTGSVNSVAFSPDGQRLATGGLDKTVNVWDARSGQPLLSLQGHTDSVYSVAFSPDGQRLATGSRDGTAKVWNTRSGQPLLSLHGHTRDVKSVAFSPDGQHLAPGSAHRTPKAWDARTGYPLFSLQGHTSSVWSVAFSPDGQRLVSSDVAGKTIVWDLQTDKPIPNAPVEALPPSSHSPDGQLFAWSDGAVVRLLRPPDAEELLIRRARTAFDAAWHQAEAKRHEQAGQWFAVGFHLAQLLQNHPGDAAVHDRLLDVHARRGDWNKLLAALDQAAATDPNDVTTHYRRGLLLLILDRRDDYAQVRTELLHRHDPIRAAAGASLLLASSLSTPAASAAAVRLLLPPRSAQTDRLRALRTAVLGPNGVVEPGQLPAYSSGAAPWLRGAALVRAGRFEEAVPLLQPNGWAGSQLFLALAEHGRGQTREAEQARERAVRWLDAPRTANAKQTNGEALAWDRRLEVELLRREVEAKIGPYRPALDSPPPMPRVP